MNFVYICRDGNNEELRYSIRSVYKNTPNPTIWVVGGKPDWYNGNYIKVRQSNTKYHNVANNLNALVNSPDIPDDFILMNDDFFIIKPIDKIETYHGGSFEDKINKFQANTGASYYTRVLKRTSNKLKSLGIEEPLDYSIHVPMRFNKEKLSSVIHPGMSFRTLYGNIYGVGGEPIFDVKIHREKTRDWADSPSDNIIELPYLSTSDASFDTVYRNTLKDMFTQPSPLEKTPRRPR